MKGVIKPLSFIIFSSRGSSRFVLSRASSSDSSLRSIRVLGGSDSEEKAQKLLLLRSIVDEDSSKSDVDVDNTVQSLVEQKLSAPSI